MDFDLLLSQPQPVEKYELIKALKVIANTPFPFTLGAETIERVNVELKSQAPSQAPSQEPIVPIVEGKKKNK